MEIDSSGGSASSAALKSHVFCVPHNGIETLSEGLGTFGVNKGVSKTFTLQFIGEGSVFVALRNQGRFNHVVGIDVELSLQWLAYQKAAGHPDYVNRVLPDAGSLRLVLESLKEQVLDNTSIKDSAIHQVMEAKMENHDDGASIVMDGLQRDLQNSQVIEQLIGIAQTVKKTAVAADNVVVDIVTEKECDVDGDVTMEESDTDASVSDESNGGVQWGCASKDFCAPKRGDTIVYHSQDVEHTFLIESVSEHVHSFKITLENEDSSTYEFPKNMRTHRVQVANDGDWAIVFQKQDPANVVAYSNTFLQQRLDDAEQQQLQQQQQLLDESNECAPMDLDAIGVNGEEPAGDVEDVHDVEVANELMNEFTDNHLIMAQLFPHLFVLGVPDVFQKGVLPPHVTERLLRSVYPRFESCDDFSFYIFNQKMRHSTLRSVALEAKSGNSNMRKWTKFLTQEDCEDLMDAAGSNPSGAEAKQLRNLLMPLVRSIGKKVMWSPGKRASQLSLLYAMCYRFGLPSDFITISQLSAAHPLVIKLGSRQLTKEPEIIWKSDGMNPGKRLQIERENPAVCAEHFDRTCRAVLEDLFGVSLDKLKDAAVGEMTGIYGAVRAVHAVTEAQARGSLHLHLLLWAEYGPTFFARHIHSPDGRAKINAYINATVSARLSAEQHTAREQKGQWDIYPTCPPTVEATKSEAKRRAGQYNFHTHSGRCRQGKNGEQGCALCMPQSLSAILRWHQCSLAQNPEEEGVDLIMLQAEGTEVIDDPPSVRPPLGAPLPEVDERVLCMTLPRTHEKDQHVVEHSWPTSACVTGNTSCQKFASGQAAKAGVLYSIKYNTKNNAKLIELADFDSRRQ